MNIILLTDYFHPIVKSGSVIMGDLAAELVNQGHSITVITFDDNQEKQLTIEHKGSMKIVRIQSRLRKMGMIGRLISEMSYSSKLIKTIKQIDDGSSSYDGVICFSPSIFYGDAINFIRKKYTAKAYLICRDIFPKWAVDSGVLKKGPLYWYFKYVERKLYGSIDNIGIESKFDINYFLKYLDKENIQVLDNWGTKHELIQNLPNSDTFDRDVVNILYGGNMAEAQDLYSLIDLIDDSILESVGKITLIGSGHQLESINKLVSKKGLKNIVILPEVDNKTYLSILSQADIGLVSLNKGLKSNNFPLKMMGYLQQGKPILASVNKNNEIIELINKYNLGLVSIAGDSKSLNKNISLMINDHKLRKTQGKNGLKIFNQRFTVDKAVEKVIQKIQ
jgi:glycosyltransferase involved in cell wall biosynthesis